MPTLTGPYPHGTRKGFWMKNEFCEEETVQVKMYNSIGQLVGTYSFMTHEKVLKEYISCFPFSPDTYIVNIQSAAK